MPELRSAGFLGAHRSRRLTGERVEFLVLTRWQSMEAVRALAGESPDRAVVSPGAVAALIDFDDAVTHYEVIEEVSLPARQAGRALPMAPVLLPHR